MTSPKNENNDDILGNLENIDKKPTDEIKENNETINNDDLVSMFDLPDSPEEKIIENETIWEINNSNQTQSNESICHILIFLTSFFVVIGLSTTFAFIKSFSQKLLGTTFVNIWKFFSSKFIPQFHSWVSLVFSKFNLVAHLAFNKILE